MLRVRARRRAHAQQRVSPDVTRVFIKESSCSMALRRSEHRLWRRFTNPCVNLGLMEAEHLTRINAGGLFSPP